MLSNRNISRALTLALLFGSLAQRAFAQATAPRAGQPGRGEVRGRVVSTVGAQPVTTAIVELVSVADSTRIRRGPARADGTFQVTGLAFGDYHVQVRALGFARPRLPDVRLSATSPSANVGDIALTAVALELQKLTVTEQRRDVQLAPDRNVYTVKDMPTTRGGSAVDVLRNVPAVDVDMDNIVSLRGDAGVIVQINGRPSPMKPAQLGNFLAQLPAAMVEKVEVIPNPSARDNPEGSAGIINIVLKRKSDAGSSAGLTVADGTTGRRDVGGNVGLQHDALTFFGSYGFSRDKRVRTESLVRDNLYASPLTFLEEAGARRQTPLSHTVTSALNYQLGKHDELSSDILYSTRKEDGTYGLLYRDLNASRQLTGLHDRNSVGTNHEDNFEATLEHKHAFSGENHELTTEVRAVRSSEGGPNRYRSQVYTLAGAPVGDPSQESTSTGEHPSERSLKMDYAQSLTDAWHLRAGYRGALEQYHTTLFASIYNPVSALDVPDPTRTNEFTYRQVVHAAYAMLTGGSGNVQAQAGLRVERAATRFELTKTAIGYNNHYASVFPSALVAYTIDESTQLKLSYSTRIRRPDDTDQLDPTPHYQDPLNLSRGDPYLKPEYVRALELGFQRAIGKSTLQITPFYRHTLDAVRRIRSIDGAGVTTTTFANVATTDALGTDATLALRAGRWSGFVGSSAFHQSSDASNLGAGLSAKTFGWSARTNLAVRISSTVDAQTILSYRGRATVEQGTNAAQTRVSFAARKKLLSDRMSLTVRVTDPFATEKEQSITNDPRFYQISDRFRRARGVLLNVTWNFGKPPKDKPIDADPGT